MPIMFNSILQEAGLPLEEVRLIRHKDKRAAKGFTPYELWRDNRPQFDLYQASQNLKNRNLLSSAYWAPFVVNMADEAVFAGIYSAKYADISKTDLPIPSMPGEFDKSGTVDCYDLKLDDALDDLIGKLIIDWGPGKLAFIQYAHNNNKSVLEVRPEFKEPDFPGFMKFIKPLSKIETLPLSWISALKASRGVYLLTCPKTKEQYVGSATGEESFWGRWKCYVQTGHGGNLGLKIRDPSDYQVSILQVSGSSESTEEILALEVLWKSKLQSKEMGLNKN